MSVPNVLATRYAGADLAAIWSPEHKIVLERQLWIAVLKAQRDLGVEVPDGVVEAYEDVVDKVDLESIAARERVTRHDVKARIEEFSALAGHEHIHKGMTSRDLTENVEQLQMRQSLAHAARPDGRHAGPARSARRRARADGDGRSVPQRRRRRPRRWASGSPPSPTSCWWRSTGSRTCWRAIRCAASRVRWALPRTCSTCWTATPTSCRDLEQRVAAHLGFGRVLDQRRPGVPAIAGLRRAVRAGPARGGPVEPRHHHPADGRQRAGHRRVRARDRSARRRCRTR